MKKITTIFIAALMSLAASAQTYSVMNFDLCGIKPYTMLSKDQLIEKFGKPISIRKDTDPDDSQLYITTYFFSNLVVEIDAKEGLCGFTVYSADYPVATSMVNINGIRVGDSMDNLKRYPFTSPILRPDNKNLGYRQLDADWYNFRFANDPSDLDVESIEVKNGKIVSISMRINTTGY